MSLIDQAARNQALNPAHSFIVQAPAGSGKTGLLVRRVLALLCIVEKPEEILAITFTRKATAEMRERVIDALFKTQNGETFEDHERDIAAQCKKVLQRDQAKNWQLLRQPHRLKIQTIDSLCAELVRKMPWSTRFGSAPQIETDVEALYRQAAQNLIQKIDSKVYEEALSTLLIGANGDLQNLQTQLIQALRDRRSWLKLIYQHHAFDSRDTIEAQWRVLLETLLAELEDRFGNSLAQELLELARYAHRHWPDNQAPLSEEMLAALYDESRISAVDIRTIQWRIIITMICTSGNFRKTVNKNNGFPTKDSAKTRLLEILGDLEDNTNTYTLVNQFRQYPEPRLTDAEWQKLSALRIALPALAQELYVLMNERNCADYDELAQRAIDALGETDRPTDLALIQDYQLKHILMDEFQDTSPTQLDLLERLTAGWQTDDGRSLFFVGDPMQSIYGFRKADVQVFLQVRDQGLNDIRPQALALRVNFRSSPDIIEWVNQTMPSVFPDKDVPALAKVKYTPSTAHHTFPGDIQTRLCIASDNQCEADEVLKLIQSIRAKQADAQIAVLARKRTPLALLAAGLRQADMAFESIELETLADQSIVQDLISLTGVFLQPMDTLAWLAVLRAPWCGTSLSDLTILRATDKPVIEALADLQTLEGLSKSGRRQLQRIASVIKPLDQTDETTALSERIYCAWLSLRAPACYQKHALDHAERFFKVLESLEADPEGLSRAHLIEVCTRQKTSSPEAMLKLMTFHKAKGLEFDQVILIGLAGISGGDNRSSALLYHSQLDDHLLLAPCPESGEPLPTKANFIKQQLKSIENEEIARLLYVAVTRAKTQLYLFGTLKRTTNGEISSPQQGSLLNLLWPGYQQAFESSETLVDVWDTDDSQTSHQIERPGIPLSNLPTPLPPLKLPESIHFTPQSIQQQEATVEFDWAQEDARIIGLAIHQMLQFTDARQLKRWDEHIDTSTIQARLATSGLITERMGPATDRVSNILRTMANDERAAWLFDDKHADVNAEWSLNCQQNDAVANYVIDRSFIDQAGIRWIIDFKTSAHEGGDVQHFLDQEERRYAAQLDQYAQLVKMLEPTREIRLGLYFPALGEWRERGVS